MKLSDIQKIQLPKIEDDRGNLSFVESNNHIPFDIKRSYLIYDVPGGQIRGGHAYRTLNEFIIALSGSFDLVLDDGDERKVFSLNRSYYRIYVPKMIWKNLENFSTNAVCLVLASDYYNANDYIRNYDEFKNINNL
ncbi:MAG: FdtA/QdtA family cupin domain-containing protein [Candidatus Cloacimonetes bacterium]|nr:FdtA/QdtA family cupin domain-containing protein [Candidatus Cloacimonadota bacterium]